MTHKAMILGVPLLGLALTACATQQTARLEARDTLAHAQTLAATTNAPAVVGKTEMSYGDRWTATNLFERAEAGYDSVTNRFNLAAGYEATGRLQQAAAIYETLLTDGQYTYAISSPKAHDPGARVWRFNVADESARRLQNISRVMTAEAVNPGSGAVAASELGVPTSAVVGGPADGRIPDDEAMRRDGF
jgi:hypothetical protein